MEERLVGYACMKPSEVYINTAFLSRAAVDRVARGKGLQRKLILARVAFAKKAGYDFAYSYTVNNPHSQNNLIDCGFKTLASKDQNATNWYKDLRNNKTRTSIVPKDIH